MRKSCRERAVEQVEIFSLEKLVIAFGFVGRVKKYEDLQNIQSVLFVIISDARLTKFDAFIK